VQPGLEVRGREYLRLIYGPDYTEPQHLERLRQRALGTRPIGSTSSSSATVQRSSVASGSTPQSRWSGVARAGGVRVRAVRGRHAHAHGRRCGDAGTARMRICAIRGGLSRA
jgi:hypothetical protein